jgi:hypothetical protein
VRRVCPRAACRGKGAPKTSQQVSHPGILSNVPYVTLPKPPPGEGIGPGTAARSAREFPPRGFRPGPGLNFSSSRSWPFAAADQACRPHWKHHTTSLTTAIGATAEDNPVRRPSASWWQLEGAHCLLLAPDLRCVACRVVCVSACPWPRLPPSDPTATPRQANRPITCRRRYSCVWGGGVLAVLTDTLGRGSWQQYGGWRQPGPGCGGQAVYCSS